MPNGRIMRIDEERECAYVVRRGRSYEAALGDVEPAARVPGARVRYRLRRADGIERADQVELRLGTRTNKRQRRFGDLTGANRPGTNVQTSGQKAYGIDVATQPFRVVSAWISAMSDQDLDAATSLYLPGAVLDIAGSKLEGRARLRGGLESSSWVGVDADTIELHGTDRYIRAESHSDDLTRSTFLFVEHGQIVEQWIDSEPDDALDEADDSALPQVLTKGTVGADDVDYAEKRLDHLLESQDEVGFARMKLNQEQGRSNEAPAIAEITIDLDGTALRAHSAAATMPEAIDLAVKRLHTSLDRRHERRQRVMKRPESGDGHWRHGDAPAVRPRFFDRPVDEREIVRHKSFAPEDITVDEAAWDMELLDYDFFLFTDLETGLDRLLERRDDGGLRLHLMDVGSAASAEVHDGVETSDEIAPEITPSKAIQLLDGAGRHFLLFRNEATGRGNVMYRRYDGHYGLITPPADGEAMDPVEEH
ncbi:MAG: ribosome hibernation promotion factor [Acidimicrobiales bacterium]